MDQLVTRDDMEIVSRVRSALAARVGAQRFELWLSRGVAYSIVDGTLRVAVAENFRLEYLRRTFRLDLAAAAREVLSGEPQVEFVLADGNVDGIVEEALSSNVPTSGQGAIEAAAAVRATVDPPPSDPAPRPRRQFASLDEFHVGAGNQVAHSAARGVVARPGQYSPLVLVGPPGCGKTHLLEGIWRAARTSSQFRRVIYLTAEQFTNQFLEALKHTGTPNFRRKYRDVELLLVDDVQFLAGKQSTIVELVHTIDTLLRDGRQLVFAADRPPLELRGLGNDLVARLTGGLVCPLAPADAATRRKIVEQLAARQGASIPPEVLTFVAGQLDGDARQLAGAINRLAATGEALGRPIDLDLARAALADLIGAARRPVRLPEIVDAVCEVFGVGADQLQSSSKSPAVTLPRMLVMFLARKYTRAALSEIGRTVGRKSHSTVVSAQHKVNEWLAEGKRVPLGHADCPLEDALRRVEAQLRVG
jgi:chromosomal replication initiator protein